MNVDDTTGSSGTTDAADDREENRWYEGLVRLEDANGNLSHTQVRDGKREVVRHLEYPTLEVDAAQLIADVTRASEGLDEVTVTFEGSLRSEMEYGFEESVEVSYLDEITLVITGWRTLTADEQHAVTAHREREVRAAEREADRIRWAARTLPVRRMGRIVR